MSGMHDKKLRFNIQFCKTDPAHLQVAELLNNKARGEKAKYIVNAVQHYERSFGISANNSTTLTDEKCIEAVVNRVLLEREKDSAGMPSDATPSKQSQSVEDGADNDTELGAQELNIIANSLKSLESIRKK